MGESRANSGGAPSNFANLTFLHGPRSCIGMYFAKMERLCVLAGWIGRFDVKSADLNIKSDMIRWVGVKPRHSPPVTFKQIYEW
jgi:cytochrome P450